MEEKSLPLVSIGLPVFNGEIGLSRALNSLLEQDYPNLEIIISDNGSTDTTPDICRKYTCRDTRLKYYRYEENRGSIWNFNRVFKYSSGKYFMWAAHDDQRELSFVSACVEMMEQCPGAVLCQAYTNVYVEGREDLLFVAHLDSFEGLTGLVERYRETLKHFPATAIYGLYRSSVMRKTQLFTKSLGTDLAFIQELSIHGEFVQVPKVLFNYFAREKWHTVHQDYQAVYGKKRKPWWYLPFVFLFFNHWNRVAYTAIPFSVKFRLWGLLIRYEIRHVSISVFIKMAGLCCPEKLKEKLGCTIYWKWMHGPNLKVGSMDLFLERVIKPTLGWWR